MRRATVLIKTCGCVPGWLLVLATTLLLLLHEAALCHCVVQQQHHRHPSAQVTPASQEELYPPLVLLGGIAQTKTSWDHHLPSLARNRRVVVYECLGQGLNSITTTSDDDKNEEEMDASLPAQARELLECLDEIMDDENDGPAPVDIAGFSFGGRVAMAAACLQKDPGGLESFRVRIRRLHLTGVGCDRSDYGHFAMKSFRDVIRNDQSLRCFAWCILLATYSSGYLRGLPEKTLERFLDHISSSNNPNGLLAILEQAEINDATDPWHVTNMANRLTQTTGTNTNSDSRKVVLGKLCVGEFDKMAPVDEVERLCKTSDWIQEDTDILSDCGHAVVLENPRAWRQSALSFLNVVGSDDDDNAST
mmetsp:Transcript_19375/g.44292  ORF Transcript_19375/g.44292 Transcript_19375/m.44292 type:complete len:363 (+) Transcript_19375:65-1153(+)